MDIDAPTALLGGLSPSRFMRRHWQRKPLLVRGAVPEPEALVDRATLLALAGRDDVESRLVARVNERWRVRHGPLPRRSLPSLGTPGWTVLVQGADLHLAAAHCLLGRFRFIPDARLDDLMLSFATSGGSVGPHLDSYDVFLLQVRGRRRWRVGRVEKPMLRDDVPLKMLASFTPTEDWLLEAGDMLYLPPLWGHDGVADGETITASIGFRSPTAESIAVDVVQRLLDDIDPLGAERRYADRGQPATRAPAQIPAALRDFAASAVDRLLENRAGRAQALGEVLSEPKPQVSFDPGTPVGEIAGVRLDHRSRMLYDERHVFLNGEAFVASGRDGRLVRRLADRRCLSAAEVDALSPEARALVASWRSAGWLRDRQHILDGEGRA